MQLALSIAVLCELTAIGPFKVTDFDTDRRLTCDFLLVNNTNVCPISQRFEVIMAYCQIIAFDSCLYLAL